MSQPTLEEIRQEDGKLPSHIWPGGYPILYLAHDGESVCPACANGENGADFTTDPKADADGWRLDGWFPFYEGAPEFCCHCNGEVESAYGDPEEAEKDAWGRSETK